MPPLVPPRPPVGEKEKGKEKRMKSWEHMKRDIYVLQIGQLPVALSLRISTEVIDGVVLS